MTQPFTIPTVNERFATVCLTYKFFKTSLLTSKGGKTVFRENQRSLQSENTFELTLIC